MVEKIDLVDLRESIRRQYADWPTGGDPVLELEARAADIIADLSVFIVKEAVQRETPVDVLLQGICAIAAIPLENLISHVPLHRVRTLETVANCLASFILSDENVQPDSVEIKTVEVGDA